jgi:hypothetical protein
MIPFGGRNLHQLISEISDDRRKTFGGFLEVVDLKRNIIREVMSSKNGQSGPPAE